MLGSKLANRLDVAFGPNSQQAQCLPLANSEARTSLEAMCRLQYALYERFQLIVVSLQYRCDSSADILLSMRRVCGELSRQLVFQT